MKRYCLVGLIFTFSVFSVLVNFASAASISGTVSYNGSQSGSIVVAVFTTPVTCSGPNAGDPYSVLELESLGGYILSDLPAGTYYLGAVILSQGLEGELQATDPWALYDGCDSITPLTLSSDTAITGRNMLLADGTVEMPNPFYSLYYIGGYSAHDWSGYWIEIFVDDNSHNATMVNVSGPGITGGTVDLGYNDGRWDSSNTGRLAFTSSPMTPPLEYDVAITDNEGTSHHEVVIQGYVEVFATNLSPDSGEIVSDTPVFSWTGVEGDFNYEIHLDSTNWHRHNLIETSIPYDGEPLVFGSSYDWHVNVADQYDNVAFAFANFVYLPSAQISLSHAINALKILGNIPEAVISETTSIDANNDQKIGLEDVIYVLQVISELKP